MSTASDLLQGRVAVVTGAGRGLGREHALALAASGAAVVVNDVGVSLEGTGTDPSPARDVVAEIEAMGGRAIANGADVTSFEAAAALVDEAVSTYGRLDILVNNAGIVRDRTLASISPAEWSDVLSVHLTGHAAPLAAAARHWRGEAKKGVDVAARVINTSSPSGLWGNFGQSNYAAAKGGIAALTVTAALELRPYGVSVNAIAPSARTRMTEGAFGSIAKPTGFDAMDPANVSPLVVALASERSGAITGRLFFVVGGMVTWIKPWHPGPTLRSAAKWDPPQLLEELLGTDGLLDPLLGMNEQMEEIAPGSTSLSL